MTQQTASSCQMRLPISFRSDSLEISHSQFRTNLRRMLTLLLLSILFSCLVACSNGGAANGGGGTGGGTGAGSGGSGGGTGGGSGGGSGGGGNGGGLVTSVWPEDDESIQGYVYHTQSLTQNQCLVNTDGVTLPQTQTFYAESWAQYRTTFWALDQNNAQLCQAGQSFLGVLLTPQQGESGLMTVNLGPGTYFLAIQDMGNPSNLAGVELDVAGGPPGTSYLGQLFNTVVKSYPPGSWETIPFTIQPNTVVWLDGGTTGGTIYLMTPTQSQSFQTTYPNGYTGGTITYIGDNNRNLQFCNLNSLDAQNAPEDCDLTSHLLPGSYVLVFVNDTSSPQSLTTWGIVY